MRARARGRPGRSSVASSVAVSSQHAPERHDVEPQVARHRRQRQAPRRASAPSGSRTRRSCAGSAAPRRADRRVPTVRSSMRSMRPRRPSPRWTNEHESRSISHRQSRQRQRTLDGLTIAGGTRHDRQKTTLVLGGTGKTGRRVAERLTRARRAGPHRLALRRAAVRLGGPRDVGGRRSRASSAVYVSYYPDLAVPGATEAIARVRRARGRERRAAARAAVRPRRARGAARRARRAALRRRRGRSCAAAGSTRTSARATCSTRCSPARSRCRPATCREPFVDADDIADVAVAALTEDGHVGRALRADRPAAADLRGGGRRDRRRDRARDPLRAGPAGRRSRGAGGAGVPADVVALLSYLFTEVLDGRNAHVTDGVQRALGRAPRDFRDYARAPRRPARGRSIRPRRARGAPVRWCRPGHGPRTLRGRARRRPPGTRSRTGTARLRRRPRHRSRP